MRDTPPDVISRIALAVSLYALYELGMLLAHFAGKRAEKKEQSQDSYDRSPSD